MSLIEILVVVTLFAVLGILVTQSVVLTLQGSKKSESLVHVRENLNYSLSIIERQIRNAGSVTPCNNLTRSDINYFDQNGVSGLFSCVNTSLNNSYIASVSAGLRVTRLTSDTVKIMVCSFVCTPRLGNNPSLVTINLTLKDAAASGIQGAEVSASTQIYLRNY